MPQAASTASITHACSLSERAAYSGRRTNRRAASSVTGNAPEARASFLPAGELLQRHVMENRLHAAARQFSDGGIASRFGRQQQAVEMAMLLAVFGDRRPLRRALAFQLLESVVIAIPLSQAMGRGPLAVPQLRPQKCRRNLAGDE